MVDQYHLSMPRVLNLDLADASLTGFASNVSGASWALTATAASDGLAHQVSVRNDSANNNAGINITFVGTDANGNAQTETIAGPAGSATVETTGYYLTLTSVTPASTWGADTADIGWVDEVSTQVLNINVTAEDVLAVNVDVTGTIVFTIQQTFDSLQDLSAIRWGSVPSAASQSADGVWNSTGGATALRVLVNSYSSGAELRLNFNATAISNSEGNGGGGGGGGGGGDVNLTEIGGNAVSVTTPGVLDVNVLSGGGSNASVSATGAAVPASATMVGVKSGTDLIALTLGQTTMSSSVPVAIASNQTDVPVSNTPLTNIGAGEYETVAASQTDQVLGATGAVGDYLSGLLVVPATTSPGNVLIQDGNGTEITVFTGGAGSVSNLVSFFIPIGLKCVNATTPGWKVTTGAAVSVLASGNFT